MRRLVGSVSGLVAVSMLLAGCSGESGRALPSQSAPPVDQSGAPTPAPPTGIPGLPHSGAPKVQDPLPSAARDLNPCDALTPSQVTTVLGTEIAGKPDTAPYGPECSWSNLTEGSRVSVAFITKTGQGLSGVYQNSKPVSKLWRELPAIQNFPAVAHLSDIEERPGRFCFASVGLADDFSMDISLSVATRKIGQIDSCEVMPQVIDLSITTIRQQVGQ